MRNVKCETGKWRSGDSRVYMLCKVAQVFSARGGRAIVLFASPLGKKAAMY